MGSLFYEVIAMWIILGSLMIAAPVTKMIEDSKQKQHLQDKDGFFRESSSDK